MSLSITVHESFDRLPQGCMEMFGCDGQESFFLGSEWFELLYRTSMADEAVPRIYVAENSAGESCCALFCAVRNDNRRQLTSLTNFYSISFGPSFVSCTDSREAALRHIVKYLATERPAWDCIDLRFLGESDSAYDWIGDELNSNGFSIHPFFQYENWYHRADGESFAEYYAHRSSRVRNTIKRKEKKLYAGHAVDVRVLKEDNGELDRAIDDYNSIYNSSWKNPEPYPDFIPELVRTCARLGILRLGLVHVDGRPAAAQIWIVSGKSMVIYKLAYDEAYSDLSVGSILSRELFRVALDEDAVAEIDYGVGSENYKRDWMTASRTLMGLHAYNTRSVAGICLALKAGLSRVVKKVAGVRQPAGR